MLDRVREGKERKRRGKGGVGFVTLTETEPEAPLENMPPRAMAIEVGKTTTNRAEDKDSGEDGTTSKYLLGVV